MTGKLNTSGTQMVYTTATISTNSSGQREDQHYANIILLCIQPSLVALKFSWPHH